MLATADFAANIPPNFCYRSILNAMKKHITSQKTLTRREVGKGLAAGLLLGTPVAARAAATGPGGTPSATLGSLTLVNDSTTTTSAIGTPTEIFGWPFAPGQVPAGHSPVFFANGVMQPFSANPANARRYWPDGSLMFCAFALRPTFSVPAGRSQTIEITSARRSWPTATRSIANELYPQALTINCPPSGIAGYDPTVQYSAYLTAVNAGNIKQARTWLVGDAGDCWGFTVNMSQTEGGVPHGQLVCNFYVHALTGGGGQLGGFRFWADLRQPYFTVDTVDKQVRLFASPNPGSPSAGVNYTVDGNTYAAPNWPFPPQFTLTSVNTSAPVDVWLGGSGYYGQLSGTNGSTYFGTPGNFQIMPVLVSGGNLPTGWSPGISWLATGSSGVDAQLFTGSEGAGDELIDPGGPGFAILNPVFWLQPFSRMSIGGADGEYIFFQGGGSITGDTPLRSGIVDLVQWARSQVIPPYNTTLSGSAFGGQIPDVPWIYPYNPYAHGALPQSLSAAGNGPYLNSLDQNDISELYNGTLNAYQQMVHKALGIGNQCYDIADDAAPNAPVNFSNNTYQGLGAPATYLQGGGSGFTPAWSFGPHQDPVGPHFEPVGFDESSGDHMPNYVGTAYLRTGRLELLDRALSAVNIVMANLGRNSTIAGYQSYGTVTADPGQLRDWTPRNITFAALIFPNDPSQLNNAGNIAFDGSQIGTYLEDLAEANFKIILDVAADAAGLYGPAHDYFAQRSLWIPVTPNGQGYAYFTNYSEWEVAFYCEAACWGAVLGGQNAANVLKLFAARWNYVLSNLEIWNEYDIVCNYGFGPDASGHVYSNADLITDDDHWMIAPTNTWVPFMSYAPTPNPSPTSLAYTVTSWFNNGYTPQNGDRFMWLTGGQGATILPSGTSAANLPYQIVDLQVTPGSPPTYNFNLADLSGNRVVVTNSGTINWFGWRAGHNIATHGASFGLDYVAIFYEVGVWAKFVLGISDFDNLIADQLYRWENSDEGQGPGLFQFGTDTRYVVAVPS